MIALGGNDKESLDTGTWLGSELETGVKEYISSSGANGWYAGPDAIGICAGAPSTMEFLCNIGWAPAKSSPFWYE
jgi:hypothetical protein